MNKQTFVCFLLNFFLIFHITVHTGNASFGQGGGGLLPMPTPEEMAEIEQFLSTLSPEELEELSKIGEEIMKEAERSGRPIFDTQPSATNPKTSTTPQPEKETQQPEKPKKPVPPAHDTRAISTLLDDLAEHIDSIFQKVSINPELEEIIAPLYEKINLFKYFIYVINDKTIITLLLEPSQSSLLKQLTECEKMLHHHDEILDVDYLQQDTLLSTPTKVHTQKIKSFLSKSKQTVHSITSFFTQILEHNGLLKNLEVLIEKYEPEALKIKEENKKKEQEAYTYQKKASGSQAPTATSSKSSSSTSSQEKSDKPVTTYSGGKQPALQPATATKTSSSDKKNNTQQKKQSEKSEKSEKKDSKKKSPEELLILAETKCKEDLAFAEEKMQTIHTDLIQFIDKQPSARYTVLTERQKETLEEINFILKIVREDLTEWKKNVSKIAGKDFKATKQKTQSLLDFLHNSGSCTNLRRVQIRVAESLKDKKITLPTELKKIKDIMDDIEKKIIEH